MKPGVFSQVYLLIVFSPKYKTPLLSDNIQERVFTYISGIITNKNDKSIIVGGMPDHIHILIGFNLAHSFPDLVRDIKRCSTNYINENNLASKRFSWQNGYGVFSYSRSQIPCVYRYIENQKQHHSGITFKQEYITLLEKFEIPYRKEFLFDFGI
jgi:putative transposase